MLEISRFRKRFGILVEGVLALLVLSLVAGATSFAATQSNPMSVVKTVVNQAIAVLGDKKAPLAERQQKLRSLVDGNFDFTTMARSALGYHWRTINDAQRKDFTRTFTTFLEDAYLNRIEDYSGQKVEFLRTRNQGSGYAEVMTQILQQGKQPVPVGYMLRHQSSKWLIYDVTVDNISIVANYRNQFNRVVNNEGFPALLTALKKKQAQLAASLGTSH